VTIQDDFKEKTKSNASARFAGAGGGTLVAVVASQLPDDNIAKNLLIYLAPSISILLTLLWGLVQIRFVNYVNDREVERLVKVAKIKLEKSIANPNISEEHREYLQKRLQEFDLISIDRIKSRIQAIAVYTGENVESKTEPEKFTAGTESDNID
jgi:hypothetical protein